MSSILADKLYFEKQINSTANRFFHSLGVRKLMQRSNFSKTKGIACFDIFSFMFSLVFTGKNLYRTVQMEGNTIPFAKDCVYRFLNNCHYNWKKFLLLLSQKAVNDHLSPLTSSDRVNVFIVDDSMFSRNRSKKVELLSRCKDHVGNRYIKGFRMLTLGWSDGHSFIPLAFSLLGSRDEKKQLCHVDSSIDKRTNGYQRRKEAIQKSTDALIHLLEQAKPYNFPVDYLLFDSWFSFPSVIVRVKDYGLNTICMLKDLPANRYEYQGQRVTLGQLYQQVDKKDCKKGVIATARVCLGTGENGCKVMARIAFIHDRSQRKQWLALLSTDTNLTDDEIIRIYGKRWDIEVFFKTVKSSIKLSKEY